ncbi:transporter substrate-binding domain-containing protein [Luteimonas aestuarii]|uniref:transporter substrate-binding domain-containing protein n=1 Tax=Luteimonas aestuarii TaxID=453837 RepID=UPI001FB61CFE
MAEGFDTRRFDGIGSAVAALCRQDVAAVIGDASVLEYFAYVNQGAGASVAGNNFSPEKYAFGLRHGSGISRPLTVQLLGMQEDGRAEMVRVKFFGSGD